MTTHLHDGRFWTFNSTKAFTKQFPYMTRHTIDKTISNLIKSKILLVSYYGVDRTRWYSINEDWTKVDPEDEQDTTDIPFPEKRKCISEKAEMHFHKSGNASYTDINTDLNSTYIGTQSDDCDVTPQKVMQLWNDTVKEKGMLPKIKELTSKRFKAVTTITKSRFKTMEDWKTYFHSLYQSKWLTGQDKGTWTADFDWVINPMNALKILEGKYFSKGNKKDTTEKSSSFLKGLFSEEGKK